MTDLPASSLIICSRNRPDLLWDTVRSVLDGSLLPTELIIVDQSETPHARLSQMDSVRGCTVRYCHNPARGASRARNAGLRVATGDILACIDDDTCLPNDGYQALITAQAGAGDRAVVTGRVLPGEVELPGGFVPTLVERTEPAVYKGRIGTDVLPSCLMSMPRRVYQTVGGFDERLGPGAQFACAEDNDYGYRVLEAGFQIVYDPAVRIYHRAWRSQGDYYPLRWTYGRGKGGFYSKYFSLKDPYIFKRCLRDVLLRLIRFPWRLLHKPRLAVGDLVYTLGVLSGCTEWLAGTLRRSADRAIHRGMP